MKKPLMNGLWKGHVLIALIAIITLFIISCKKDLLKTNDEFSDPNLVSRNEAYSKGPQMKTINLTDFKRQVDVASLGKLAASFQEYKPNKDKLMSVNMPETYAGFNIQTDSINVVETNNYTSYVFPVKLSSPRAITFQNLTIQKNKLNNKTVAFINTYTPSQKWITDWKAGKPSKFDGNIAVTFLNLGNNPVPVNLPTSSAPGAGNGKGKISYANVDDCYTIDYWYAIPYSCSSGRHWPGDPGCRLDGSLRAGYFVVYFDVTYCGSGGGDGGYNGDDSGYGFPGGGGGTTNPGTGGGGTGGGTTDPGNTGGGTTGDPGGGGNGGGGYIPPFPPGNGYPPIDPGTGGGGSGGSGGGGGGTTPTPPSDYNPCNGNNPPIGTIGAVKSGATGAKLMVHQLPDCDPTQPPVLPPVLPPVFDENEPILLPLNFDIEYGPDYYDDEAELDALALLFVQENAPLSSMIPEMYYKNGVRVDMANAPVKGRTALGHPRNATYFWKQVIAEKPQMFSPRNRNRILSNLAPEVDEQWIKYNPTHKNFDKLPLDHHHEGQGRYAYAIPRKVHQKWTSILHEYRRTGKIPGIRPKINGLLSVFQVFTLFTDIQTGNPDAWVNWFGPHQDVGKLYKLPEKNVYFEITKQTTTKDNTGKIIKAIVTYDVYDDYIWDEDEKRYMGVIKLGTFTEYINLETKTTYDRNAVWH